MKITGRTRRAARELFRACVVDGELNHARARQVAERLGTSSRRGALALLTAFHRRVRLERDRRTAIIESAVPLGEELRAGVADRLHRIYGPTLVTSFTENAALIGGMRIKVGSDVYDGSIYRRLERLAAAL
jgi:F-type H+-transporting ATPase subunit delta